MRRRLLLLTVLLLIVSTVGCSLSDIGLSEGNPSGGEPDEDPTEAPPTESPPEPGGGATLVMNNTSGQTICYVNISLTKDTTWGEDRLGPTETIPPSGSRTFEISPDTYDLRALDCDRNEIDTQRDVNMSGTYTWNVQGGDVLPDTEGTASVIVSNDSEQVICYVRISPAGSPTWGEDQLGPTGLIGVGEDRTFEISPGAYDLRVENCDNDEIDTQWGINVIGTYTWDVSGGPPLEGISTLVLNNDSGQTICYVRISLSSTPTSGEDQLGDSEVIGPGESRTWSDLPAGVYDLRAEDCDYLPIDADWGVRLSGTYVWNVVDRW